VQYVDFDDIAYDMTDFFDDGSRFNGVSSEEDDSATWTDPYKGSLQDFIFDRIPNLILDLYAPGPINTWQSLKDLPSFVVEREPTVPLTLP
jgi:hypothetical protein